MSAATIPSAGGNCVPRSEAIWLCAITKAIAPKSRAVSKLARVRSARAVRSTTANTSKKRTFVTRRTSSAALIHTLRPKLASNKHRQRQCRLAGVPVAHPYQLTEAEGRAGCCTRVRTCESETRTVRAESVYERRGTYLLLVIRETPRSRRDRSARSDSHVNPTRIQMRWIAPASPCSVGPSLPAITIATKSPKDSTADTAEYRAQPVERGSLPKLRAINTAVPTSARAATNPSR